jgi:glycosyltransferase involved in cell wall biosynthesis
MAKILFRTRLIWHARDMPKTIRAAKVCSFFCSRIIAVSNTVKNLLINLGIKEDVIYVIYNGIATDDLRLDAKENHTDCLTFASIGQFVPWKKQLLFIKAAERFLEDGCDANFILIGDDIFGRNGKYKKSLLEKIKTSPFASRIQVEGWQDNLSQYWKKIDCFIHPADKEPFGRVIIEAMAHNVLVIAADSCGPAEIIQDSVTGLLFKPDDVEELARAMERIAADKDLMRRLSENAKQYVISNFQAEETAEKVTRVYEKLLVA